MFKSTLPLARYLFDWYFKSSRWQNQTGFPTILNLPITDNCNSRCVMCDVWKTKSTGELSAGELIIIFEDKLFSNIEHVGISGGEPSLRADLVEIVSAIVEKMKKLKSLSITTHGFHSSRWQNFLPKIQEICNEDKIRFVLNLSIDGIGESHDNVRKIPGGFDRVMKTYQLAKALNVKVRFQTTISKPNVYGALQVLKHNSDLNEVTDFRTATVIHRLDNFDSMQRVNLGEHEKSFFADFLVSSSLMEKTPSPARRLFYRDLSMRLIKNTKRKAPCYFQREGVLLTAHGDLYHCSISKNLLGNVKKASAYELYFSKEGEKQRNKLIRHDCTNCLHDQSGAWSPGQLFSETIRHHQIGSKLIRIFSFVQAFFAALPHLTKMMIRRPSTPEAAQISISKVVCIGMYGGEHVGDAAILGGVILRLIQKYNIQEAYVSSFRPDRTQRWVDSLKLPIPIRVIAPKETTSYIHACDALVLAGGPVMELPTIILQQLIYVSQNLSLGKPFIIEGVGIGPFKQKITRWFSSLLFRQAKTLSVRTITDSEDNLVRSLKPEISQDPAFDYLSTRKGIIIPGESRVEKFLPVIPDDRKLMRVGLNLRPLWKKYIFSSLNDQGIQRAFLDAFAQSLVSTTDSLDFPVEFYFFPMNADQFGFSDLDIAYELKSKLSNSFPLKIWEIEPDIDLLLSFLQKMDAVIAMRFHAVVFALSQGIPLLAIDYSYGRDGKVSNLLNEYKYSNHVTRIDTFTSEWMIERLSGYLKSSTTIRNK